MATNLLSKILLARSVLHSGNNYLCLELNNRTSYPPHVCQVDKLISLFNFRRHWTGTQESYESFCNTRVAYFSFQLSRRWYKNIFGIDLQLVWSCVPVSVNVLTHVRYEIERTDLVEMEQWKSSLTELIGCVYPYVIEWVLMVLGCDAPHYRVLNQLFPISFRLIRLHSSAITVTKPCSAFNHGQKSSRLLAVQTLFHCEYDFYKCRTWKRC